MIEVSNKQVIRAYVGDKILKELSIGNNNVIYPKTITTNNSLEFTIQSQSGAITQNGNEIKTNGIANVGEGVYYLESNHYIDKISFKFDHNCFSGVSNAEWIFKIQDDRTLNNILTLTINNDGSTASGHAGQDHNYRALLKFGNDNDINFPEQINSGQTTILDNTDILNIAYITEPTTINTINIPANSWCIWVEGSTATKASYKQIAYDLCYADFTYKLPTSNSSLYMSNDIVSQTYIAGYKHIQTNQRN